MPGAPHKAERDDASDDGAEGRLLIADDRVRVVRADGVLLRELTIDAERDYQPRLHSSSMS